MFRARLRAWVSTNDQQTIPLQSRAMREWTALQGWTIASQAADVHFYVAPRLSTLGPSFEAVSKVANGLDINWEVRVGFDFGAQGGHTAVDTAGRHNDRIFPHGVQDVVPR